MSAIAYANVTRAHWIALPRNNLAVYPANVLDLRSPLAVARDWGHGPGLGVRRPGFAAHGDGGLRKAGLRQGDHVGQLVFLKRGLAALDRLQLPALEILTLLQPQHGLARLIDENAEPGVIARDRAHQGKLRLFGFLRLRRGNDPCDRDRGWRRRRRTARRQEDRPLTCRRELLERHRPQRIGAE